jgi:hypothetical protein
VPPTVPGAFTAVADVVFRHWEKPVKAAEQSKKAKSNFLIMYVSVGDVDCIKKPNAYFVPEEMIKEKPLIGMHLLGHVFEEDI